jgi:hypothetical protein
MFMPDQTPRRLTRRTLAAGATALGAAASLRGRAGAHLEAVASPDATPSPDSPALLLRMEPFGGTQPPELQLIAMPDFSLFDDGSIYRLGPVIAVFPPAALPNVTRMQVSASAIAAIMGEARAAGLDQPLTVPNEPLSAESPSHRFLFNDHGTMVESRVWGLNVDAEQAPDWGDEALAQHQALRSFAAYLANLPMSLPAEDLLEQEMPIDPDRLQVLSFEASPDLALASGVPNFDQPPLEWPLATSLEERSTPLELDPEPGLPALGCVEIGGADAQAVVETSRQGDLLSPWLDDGTTYGVLLKPLLPDQRGCLPPNP